MFELFLSGLGGSESSGAFIEELSTVGAPEALTSTVMGVWKKDVYFLGGYNNSNGTSQRSLYAYSLDTKEFRQLADAPDTLLGHRMIVGVAKLIVWGNGKLYIYDIANNTWTIPALPGGSVMPGEVGSHMVCDGHIIYFLGGKNSADGTGNLKCVQYNSVSGVWTAKAVMPAEVVDGGATVLNNKIILAYGTNAAGDPNPSLYEYDITANTWSVKFADIVSVDAPRNNPGVGIFGNNIYFIGGNDSLRISTYDLYTGQFVRDIGTITEDINNASGFVVRNKWLAFGSTAGTKFIQMDPYAGKPKPKFVVIPYQELWTGSELKAAMGATSTTTVTNEGMYYYLMRYDSETWLIMGKHFLTNVGLNDLNYRSASGRAYTLFGYSILAFGLPTQTLDISSPYVKAYGRLSQLYGAAWKINTLANFSYNGIGFGSGVLGQYEWTGSTSGAYDQRAVGGTQPGGATINLNKISDKAQARPLFKLTNPSSFPW